MTRNRVAAPGGSTRRGGFTMIELLVVLIVIGLLIRLAVPHFFSSQNGAKLAAIQTDVHNAEIAEETYINDFKVYGTLAQLQGASLFQLSTGNTMAITTAATGYTIAATNSSITSNINNCTVQVGAGAAATVDGKITCP
jgi:prepilin-type N-terminal cleavage/methylation domain-containing protein